MSESIRGGRLPEWLRDLLFYAEMQTIDDARRFADSMGMNTPSDHELIVVLTTPNGPPSKFNELVRPKPKWTNSPVTSSALIYVDGKPVSPWYEEVKTNERSKDQ